MSVTRNGKPAKVRKTFRREAEAKSWRADALAAANRGELRSSRRDTRTLAEAMEEFIDGMRSGAVRPKRRATYKPATIRTYEQHVRIYLRGSPLGWTKVCDVRRPEIQEFADRLLGTGLAPGTVSNVLNPIQAFFRREVDRDRLTTNPAARIDLPEIGGRKVRIASAPEAAKLIAALSESDRALWATAFYAGLRRGELRALRWVDVDLGTSRIAVERSWDQYEGPLDPKSETSRRTVPLLSLLRDFLDEHKLRTGRDGEQLVFGRTAADPFAPTATDRRAKRFWKEAGLTSITMHECRHTFASLLIDSGTNPKAVQEFMGHSKIQTTFDTYGHLFPGSHDEVRARMDAYLSASAQPVRSEETDPSKVGA